MEDVTVATSSETPSSATGSLPPVTTSPTKNALVVANNDEVSSSNLFNNLPPLLPLSPSSQQENSALGLNNGSSGKNTENSKLDTIGGNTTSNTTTNKEILVNQ